MELVVLSEEIKKSFNFKEYDCQVSKGIKSKKKKKKKEKKVVVVIVFFSKNISIHTNMRLQLRSNVTIRKYFVKILPYICN
jgi:hypothetical protein